MQRYRGRVRELKKIYILYMRFSMLRFGFSRNFSRNFTLSRNFGCRNFNRNFTLSNFGCRNFSVTPEGNQGSATTKLKNLWGKYGWLTVSTYFSVYVGTLCSFYTAISSGYFTANHAKKMVKQFSFLHDRVDPSTLDNVETVKGRFLIAWVATKLVEPLRAGVTIALIPWLARVLQRGGGARVIANRVGTQACEKISIVKHIRNTNKLKSSDPLQVSGRWTHTHTHTHRIELLKHFLEKHIMNPDSYLKLFQHKDKERSGKV
eukprot:GHVR01099023.1.p1 GENE.GHVR01099023.1~~GHVR01099023.1.p1  ORF type:complete len:262 (+),score=46.84 GHVR01099023.1:1-786(+)